MECVDSLSDSFYLFSLLYIGLTLWILFMDLMFGVKLDNVILLPRVVTVHADCGVF